ncbi:WD40 repeat domain-containing protein [Streptomyces sp. OP7]|uniref:WD40 repeat domain-containing protein n=1 Tax=Streptomyces sp. OP7 TaxID=3142462 RepID=UPI0032E85330
MTSQPIRTQRTHVIKTGTPYDAWPALAETADGQLLVLSSSGGGADCSRWDPESGRRVWRFAFDDGGGGGQAVACPPEGGAVLASAGEDGVRRLNALTGQELPSPLMEDVGTVWGVAACLLPGGHWVFVGAGHDGGVHRWDALTGAPLGSPLKGHGCRVTAVTSVRDPDGTALIASGDEAGRILRWDAATGEPIGEPVANPGGGVIRHLSSVVLPNRSVLLVGTDADGALQRWKAATGEPVGEPIPLDTEHPWVATAVVGGTARLFASGTDDLVREWDPVTGELVAVPWAGVSVAALECADGSTVIATGSREGDVRLHRPVENAGVNAEQVQHLVEVLLNPHADIGARDDAAMDLYATDDPRARAALLQTASDVRAPYVVKASAGESLGQIAVASGRPLSEPERSHLTPEARYEYDVFHEVAASAGAGGRLPGCDPSY